MTSTSRAARDARRRLVGARSTASRAFLAAVGVVAAAAARSAGAAAIPPDLPGEPARVAPFAARVAETRFPSYDDRGRVGTTRWRVVTGTGNCCENYLTSTADGVLADFGDDYLRFSVDAGRSWSEVTPPDDTIRDLMGEGAIATAPGGDIVGVSSTYGDALVSFKYDGDTGSWRYAVGAAHTAPYDRPAIAVVPGPFTIAGATVPYLTMQRGGFGAVTKNPWFYSIDGLNYTLPDNRPVEQHLPATSRWLDLAPSAERDWVQPHEQAGVVPLGDGVALGVPPSIGDRLDDVSKRLTVLDRQTLRWSEFRFPEPRLEGPAPTPLSSPQDRLVADSRGWLHHVVADGDVLRYQMSSDGGRSWTAATATPVRGYRFNPYFVSLRAHGGLRITAVAVNVSKPGQPGTASSLNMVFRFSTAGPTPRLVRRYVVGDGGGHASAHGIGPLDEGTSFLDFTTIAFLPDGRIATSFIDGDHPTPAIAVEL